MWRGDGISCECMDERERERDQPVVRTLLEAYTGATTLA